MDTLSFFPQVADIFPFVFSFSSAANPQWTALSGMNKHGVSVVKYIYRVYGKRRVQLSRNLAQYCVHDIILACVNPHHSVTPCSPCTHARRILKIVRNSSISNAVSFQGFSAGPNHVTLLKARGSVTRHFCFLLRSYYLMRSPNCVGICGTISHRARISSGGTYRELS